MRQEIGFATPEEMQGYIIELSKQIKNKEFDTLSMSQETAKAFNEETLRSLEQMRKMEEQIDQDALEEKAAKESSFYN